MIYYQQTRQLKVDDAQTLIVFTGLSQTLSSKTDARKTREKEEQKEKEFRSATVIIYTFGKSKFHIEISS